MRVYALLTRREKFRNWSSWFRGDRFIEYTRRVPSWCSYFFMWRSNSSKCLRQIDNIAVARDADDRNALWRYQISWSRQLYKSTI